MPAEHKIERALHHLQMNNIDRGEELLVAAIEEAKSEADGYGLVRAMFTLGDLYFWCQLWDDARPLFEQVVELADKLGDDVCDDERNAAKRYLADLALPPDLERSTKLWEHIHK